jgi:adenosylcobinamide-phosphate synthase
MLMAWAFCRLNGSACLAWDGLAGAAWPLAVLVALAIDRLWGEPPARWHPVVGMGAYLAWAGRRFVPLAGSMPKRPRVTFAQGALAWTLGALMVLALVWALEGLTGGLPWWAWVLAQGICLKPMLAWRMLRDEVGAVETALGDSLAAGRERLSRLVSRDVTALDAAQARESAIETLAENLNDSVVAPLFWFAVAGLPGAALYRFANTADAMWGYRGERQGRDWTWAGKWAARADDVLSWLPARITALLLGLQAAGVAFGRLALEAGRTPSPNSGWPMAAMALALGVRLSKPGVYTLNAGGRAPAAADTARALVLAGRAVGLLAGLAALAALALWLTGRAA